MNNPNFNIIYPEIISEIIHNYDLTVLERKGEIYSPEQVKMFECFYLLRYSNLVGVFHNKNQLSINNEVLTSMLPNLEEYLNYHGNRLDPRFLQETYSLSLPIVFELLYFSIKFKIVLLVKKLIYDIIFNIVTADISKATFLIVYADKIMDKYNDNK